MELILEMQQEYEICGAQICETVRLFQVKSNTFYLIVSYNK
ncbi:unnamed protein product [Paramecium sonneborni]|uniref:Uncharacterized protein n=1 Tax=Paramecium sonneborni TaxID=65129 RepID=A0A8S1QTF7_9CILI|nr:unnamed protein product [Paramecium sonneborni]